MNGRFFRGLNGTQEAVDAIEQVSSETLNVVETTRELRKQTAELSNELGLGEEKEKVKEDNAKNAAQSPQIPTDQENRAD
jgi:hypothetical protein